MASHAGSGLPERGDQPLISAFRNATQDRQVYTLQMVPITGVSTKNEVAPHGLFGPLRLFCVTFLRNSHMRRFLYTRTSCRYEQSCRKIAMLTKPETGRYIAMIG